ncbi:MAG: hypothetical protein N2510_06275 [Ignavibacteria bacterium]|nr:hypothetical protein [Ignavibacteria bacterium]
MQLKIFLKTFPETTACPSCGKIGTIRRSRSRNLFETILKATNIISPYKCRECGWRGYQKKYTMNFNSFITLGIYIILILLSVYIITAVLKRNFGS